MKLLVTGGTGTVGGEVLNQALRHPKVTHVVALVRRQLPAGLAASEKLTQVLIDDFETWPEEVIEKCKGVEACVWSLGVPSQGKATLTTYRKINVGYLQHGLSVCADTLAPRLPEGATKIRFVYVSGIAAERDGSKSLWFMADIRRIRGEGETATLDFPATHPTVDTAIFRPGGVLGSANNAMHTIMGSNYSVKVDVLAAALLESALNGTGSRIMENAEIISTGKQALDARRTASTAAPAAPATPAKD